MTGRPALLGRGDWDDVECKRGRVSVSGVEPGDEERLRAFLEGVIAQANADHPPDDEVTKTTTTRRRTPSAPTNATTTPTPS